MASQPPPEHLWRPLTAALQPQPPIFVYQTLASMSLLSFLTSLPHQKKPFSTLRSYSQLLRNHAYLIPTCRYQPHRVSNMPDKSQRSGDSLLDLADRIERFLFIPYSSALALLSLPSSHILISPTLRQYPDIKRIQNIGASPAASGRGVAEHRRHLDSPLLTVGLGRCGGEERLSFRYAGDMGGLWRD